MRTKLTEKEVQAKLCTLDGWRVEAGRLRREFEFSSFTDAFCFMTRGAILSEKLDHHPDWSNSYNKLSISLTTHSAGGITDLDFEWAAQIGSAG